MKRRPDFEYEIYVPLKDPKGKAHPASLLKKFKERLLARFGGLTDTRVKNKGLWKIGNVVHVDEILIWRVLSLQEGTKDRFIKQLKSDMETQLNQKEILNVRRQLQAL